MFRSAPTARGATDCHQGVDNAVEVSIRAPRGERRSGQLAVEPIKVFRSAPPRGERRRPARQAQRRSGRFDPRPRAGSDIPAMVAHGITNQFRSAPPRGERHPGDGRARHHQPVSIRAPARGATRWRVTFKAFDAVSIRAPARGATMAKRAWPTVPSSFDPRPRAGSDFHRLSRNQRCNVSIRAPARGATRCAFTATMCSRCFDPRPRAGSDSKASAKPTRLSSFDPRPRAGSDAGRVLPRRPGRVSIRAPARGATSNHDLALERWLFRSAPPRGERHGQKWAPM